MKYLVSLIAFMVLFTGCGEDKKEQAIAKVEKEVVKEDTLVKDETIEKVADTIKDKTTDVIDTAAQMAKELSKESAVIAKDMKEESNKVITKIAKETKVMTDVAVEKINEAKENLDVTIEQVIEDEKNTKPQFFTNPSSSDSTTTDTTNSDATTQSSSSESSTTEESSETLSSEETTQAENLYLKCAGCHGPKGERAALNKSAVIQGWDAQKIVDALQGYKAGTYGSVMKGLMQGQVANLTDAEIQLLADYISTLK